MGRTLSLCLLFVLAGAGYVASIEWTMVAEPDVVQIVTLNEDGSTKETKIWIVRVDDQAYIRTGRTRWYRNLERSSSASLRAQGEMYSVQSELVTDADLLERVNHAFRAKYGFADRMSGLVRLGQTRIMRLVER